MKGKAKWSVGATVKAVKDGKATATVPLLDAGALQGHVTFELSEDRELVVRWIGEPGSAPLRGFQAWSTV
jgi:hypothetical protein